MKDVYYLEAIKVAYYNTLVSKIEEIENSSEEDHKIDQKFLDIWTKKLESKVDQLVLEFSNNLRPTYMMTDVEFKNTFKDAASEFLNSTTEDLINKSLLIKKIDQNGEIVYELKK